MLHHSLSKLVHSVCLETIIETAVELEKDYDDVVHSGAGRGDATTRYQLITALK
jgi:hypothetical protein